MEYLLKASAVICIFYICFQLLLKRETFFNHNRWFLIIGLILALVFPLVIIPVYVSAETIVSPDIVFQVNEIANNNTTDVSTESTFQWTSLLPTIYIIGLSVLFLQFIFQFGSLIWLLLKNPKNKEGTYTYVIVNHKISPFSFFKWIVFNPKNYTKDELELILMHEKVHVNQMHSLDIIFSQLACVIFWFNPLIWLYKKEIRQNLEYIADNETQATSQNEKAYQHLLLKTSVKNANISLSNNFYNSQIKKRIIMLHKSKSNHKKQWRYLLVLPLLAGLLMSMNTEKVYVDNTPLTKNRPSKSENNTVQKRAISKMKSLGMENEKLQSETIHKPEENNSKETKASKKIIEFIITKNTTDSELDKIKEKLKNEGLAIKFKGVKRTKNGEIRAIKIEAKSKNSSTNYQISSDDEAIEPVKIVFDQETNNISIGNGKTKHKTHSYIIETENGGKHKIHKRGKGNNVFVISKEKTNTKSGDTLYMVIDEGSNGKTIKKSKTFEVISEGDKNVEVIIEDDGNSEDEIIIVNGKKIKTDSNDDVEVIVEEKNNKNVWVTKTDNKDESYIIEINDDKNNVFFSDDNGENPLFIIDGKEVTKEKIRDLNPKQIESLTVLKDKSATEKYGDKGKNGVIVIKTKKN
ncbi:M56 family metallopeptidase [Winogradskyella poriferorum]|uniref:M56 family metallopeptidase n=1 Tax=Winogradskyella poriferorum TaxID=307627 RepID=UPI003D662B8D